SERTPRMAMSLIYPALDGANVNPGVNRDTSSIFLMPCSSMVACEYAVILMGTVSADCSRRVAVTVISARSGAELAALDAAASEAWAQGAQAPAMSRVASAAALPCARCAEFCGEPGAPGRLVTVMASPFD